MHHDRRLPGIIPKTIQFLVQGPLRHDVLRHQKETMDVHHEIVPQILHDSEAEVLGLPLLQDYEALAPDEKRRD